MIGFEASVGGGIPCIQALRYGLVGNRIRSVTGILNGTTNYILSMMDEENLSFKEALKDAQKKGFAEVDPTFDIEGYDAGHKISLLAMLAYNKKVDFSTIPIDGITKINKVDITYAKNMGYVIKLLGIAKYVDGAIDIRVHPTMLHQKHPLASVRDEYNAVMFDGDMTDPVILYGKGAGSNPTASAIISDIVRIADKEENSKYLMKIDEEAQCLAPGERLSRYYIRIQTEDRPGILSKISGCLGDHTISISSVLQKESHEQYVPLIIMTHKAKEDSVSLAVKEIENFSFVKDEVIIIRVEDI